MESGPCPCIAGGPRRARHGRTRQHELWSGPADLAGQKLPPVACLIADDHLALNSALDQLITAAEQEIARPRQARCPDPEPRQTHNGVIGRNITRVSLDLCAASVARTAIEPSD
jgi:hypothetical protein